MALAAMILGIVGLALCWVPALGAVLALVALILGIACLVKKDPKRGFVITGVITGAIGLVAGAIFSFLILGGAIYARLDDAKEKDARIGACTVKNAVQLYIANHPRKCPTAQDLLDDGVLDKSKGTKDPWEQDYVIDCSGVDPDVYSQGEPGEGKPIRCEKSSEE